MRKGMEARGIKSSEKTGKFHVTAGMKGEQCMEIGASQ